MPNFGVDIPMGMNMGPALTRPGAPDRPQHPGQGDGRKPAVKSSGKLASTGYVMQMVSHYHYLLDVFSTALRGK